MTLSNLQNCHDCGALPGELHKIGCDVERCPFCGCQMISCSCGVDIDKVPDFDRMPWTGEWPGEAECREYGWYAKFGPGGWVPCGPNDPEADTDLNRLRVDAVWDPYRKRWMKK